MTSNTMAAGVLANLLYAYQREAIECPARFTWNVWSRQVGKSHGFSLKRVLRGLARSRNQIFLSAGKTQSRELMMKAETHLRALQVAASGIIETKVIFDDIEFTQMEIRVPAIGAGSKPFRIIGLPANPRTARGFTGDLFLDEFAMHQHDRDIWRAAFPIVSREGGELDVCSTPCGRQNMFYELGNNEIFHRTKVTIFDAVAKGCPHDPEVLRKGVTHEDDWRQEYLCEFLDEVTAFLTYELIQEAEDVELPRELDLAALKDRRGDVVVGVDIGRKRDLTVVWPFEVVDRTLRSLGLIEMVGLPFREQREVIFSVLGNRCVRRACIDASGLGMQLAEECVDRFGGHTVEACTLTAQFKEQAASRMRNKFLDKLIRIPVDTQIRNDLHSVRKSVTAAGNVRLEAPREDGSHADRFWACALACNAAAEDSGPREAIFGGELRSAGARDLPVRGSDDPLDGGETLATVESVF